MSKHTPGPWSRFGVYSHIEIRNADGALIAVIGSDMLKANRHADARLIVAAPELLDVLKETDKDLTALLSNLSDAEQRDPKWEGMREIVKGWRARNRTATLKATGESA